MPLIKSEVLSDDPKFPFGNSVFSFFEKYYVFKTVESYYFYPWPEECNTGTSAIDLLEIDYTAEVIFWIPMDSFIDQNPYNYYTSSKPEELKKVEKICELHPDKTFIFLPNFYNLNNLLSVPNLFSVDNMINTKFRKKYKRCDNKKFDSKKWVCLNRRDEPHRVALISYLLSKDLDKFGLISSNDSIEDSNNIDLILKYFKFKYKDQENILRGFSKLKTSNFEKLITGQYPRETLVDTLTGEITGDCMQNYHENLFPVYEKTALEIISCSIFSEPTPTFGEKEIQSVYAKNFPIFIGSKGTANKFRDIWGIDIFEDIIDHSYDNIDDPTKRLKAAIDLNIHLLNGSTPIDEIWFKNKTRFEKNCAHMDNLLYDSIYQRNFDHERIKIGLDHFNIKYSKKSNIN